MKVEFCDFRYDEGFRSRQDAQLCPTLTTHSSGISGQPLVKNNGGGTLKIRRLTPKECWRLMGFDDEAYEHAESVNSHVQLYKQAGNSIVVNVLEAIFVEMLPGDDDAEL